MHPQQARAELEGGAVDPHEVDRVGVALLARGAASHVDIPRLIARWANNSADVNNPSWEVDDYTNELTGRDLLQMSLGLASLELSSKIRSMVERADAVFLANTVPDDDHVLERFFRVGDGWWWARLPRNRSWGGAES